MIEFAIIEEGVAIETGFATREAAEWTIARDFDYARRRLTVEEFTDQYVDDEEDDR